jgi:hypothetical protein
MKTYSFYGFGRDGAIIQSSLHDLVDDSAASELGRTLERRYERVELWLGPVCCFRSSRAERLAQV